MELYWISNKFAEIYKLLELEKSLNFSIIKLKIILNEIIIKCNIFKSLGIYQTYLIQRIVIFYIICKKF